MATERLFVYGSLKRGGPHHAELRGALFLGEACTAPGYALAPLGDYLALVEEAGAGSVSGELFEVDQALLSLLDEFEGDDYARTPLRAQLKADALSSPQTAETTRALAYLRRKR